ncbi:hypothetical protein BT69DRAFT_1295337 [Atractiella rhizophila]|nr:hypothetical protein BT69DRAFT_1295337 [Atractiella rhizophila]
MGMATNKVRKKLEGGKVHFIEVDALKGWEGGEELEKSRGCGDVHGPESQRAIIEIGAADGEKESAGSLTMQEAEPIFIWAEDLRQKRATEALVGLRTAGVRVGNSTRTTSTRSLGQAKIRTARGEMGQTYYLHWSTEDRRLLGTSRWPLFHDRQLRRLRNPPSDCWVLVDGEKKVAENIN